MHAVGFLAGLSDHCILRLQPAYNFVVSHCLCMRPGGCTSNLEKYRLSRLSFHDHYHQLSVTDTDVSDWEAYLHKVAHLLHQTIHYLMSPRPKTLHILYLYYSRGNQSQSDSGGARQSGGEQEGDQEARCTNTSRTRYEEY